MKEISPKSDQLNKSLDDIHIDKLSDNIHTDNISYSNITLINNVTKLSEEGIDNFTICLEELNNNTCIVDEQNIDSVPQNVSPIQSITFEEFSSIKGCEMECNAGEVEVIIERNPEFDTENTQDLDTNVKTISSHKTITFNDTKEQNAIVDYNNVEIRPTSDSDSEDRKPNQKIVRRSKRELKYDKSYLDFIDDDSDNSRFLNEALYSEESSLELNENNTTTSSLDSKEKSPNKGKLKKKKLKKKQMKRIKTIEKDQSNHLPLKKSKSKTETKKENMEKKKKGELYVNSKGEIVEGKRVKPNPCVGVNCGNDCGNISEERRVNIFNHFWGLGNFQRRKDWIGQYAVRKPVRRPSKSATLNRSQTYEYFINEGEGRRKVCQKFLIATVDVTQRFILYTLSTMVDGFVKKDARGTAGGHNKTSEDVIEEAKDFIHGLPLLPSHYCRKDSTKLYLPVEFKNMSNLYRIYQAHCKGKKIMSFKVFSSWFKKTFNIGIHIPKKDKCLLCFSSKSFDVKTEEEMEKIQRHEAEKEESYKRFIFHQTLTKRDKGSVCASFDLQKVLNTPYGESMTLYYYRKIAVYNFTIYESGTKLGVCNLWTEADAKRGANEIATCLLKYIKNVDKRGNVKQIILYCDSCFGQNKNKTILAMLRYALITSNNIETIQINYLVPGHTYMPVDSMHATIENSIKNVIVWAPSQWPTIVQMSRKNPEPYTVNVLNGEDFSGFDDIVDHTFKKNQNIQISKISIVTFRKKHPEKMFVKSSMLPDAETVEVKLSALSNANPKQNLYPAKLPISQKKYEDLKKLVQKQVIPKRFAREYLDFKTSSKVKDCLPDTDDEDDQ